MATGVERWIRVGKVSFGKAVFASKDIPAKTVVGHVKGQVMMDPQYGSSHCIDLGSSMTLEPQAPFRFLNHCCTPNCSLCITEAFYEDGTPAPAEVTVESLCAIPRGGELTIDYHWSAEGAIKCLCGSSQCRGWVVAAEELPKLMKSKKSQTRQRC